MQQHLVLRCARAIASFGLLAHSAPSLSIQGTPAPERWQVNWGDQYCTLSRATTSAPPAFLLRVIPGTEKPDLVIPVGRGLQPMIDINEPAVVSLTPEGRFEVTSTIGEAGGDRFIILKGIDLRFLDQFANATAFEASQDGQARGRWAFSGARDAVAALQECINGALSDWGVDATRLASLRQRPELTQGWTTAADYPNRAMRAGISGTAIARISVDASGRVSDCVIVATSGNADLDQASCASATWRGRYRPAIGSNGEVVATDIIVDVRWEVVDVP
jgi:TonB family protein